MINTIPAQLQNYSKEPKFNIEFDKDLRVSARWHSISMSPPEGAQTCRLEYLKEADEEE